MQLRSLGRTGIQVGELGLGTWGLSGDGYGPVAERDQRRVLERARVLGVDLFECSPSYAAGAMERLLGELFGSDPSARIVTLLGTFLDEVPPRKRFDPASLERALGESMERLKRSRLDVVLLHNPSVQALARGEATSWLKAQVEAGRIGAWGVSAGSGEAAEAALDQGAPILQLAFNALWPGDFRRVAERVTRDEVGFLGRSILAHGLLCGLWAPDHGFGLDDHRVERWTPDDLRRRLRQLDALRPAVRGEIGTLRAVALRWALHETRLSSAILGPRSTLQLDQLLREAGSGAPYLAPEVFEALEGRLADVGARP